jgi:hypothetical protein
MNWKDYYLFKNKINPQLPNSLRFPDQFFDLAIDVGAGNLTDSQYLLSRGFSRIIAVDPNSLESTCSKISVFKGCIRNFRIPENCDLLICFNTICWMSLEDRNAFFEMFKSLKKGCVVSFNCVTPYDQFHPKESCVDVSKIEKSLVGFSFKSIRRKKIFAKSYSGHHREWDIWRVIARK